ncbi:hypothetical protein LCGC14_1020120 [marine sediment metagenome]|uniref:MCM C-terminal AAA(+) ATPase domain-containing protein n=1 Tax=marine sediment metagenome TaxID=412755 RepID=A0A0F9R3K7_9ZZZZ
MKVHFKIECPEYIEELSNQILAGNSDLILRISLKKFADEGLFDYYRKETKNCSEELIDIITEELKWNSDIKEIIEKDQLRGIHLIPDISEFESIIPEITEFSKSLVDYIGKLVRLKCRFLDSGLHKKYIATKLIYQCLLCGEENEILQEIKLRGRYRKPKFCFKRSCKAKTTSDFKLIREKAEKFEVGYFIVGDLDQNNPEREKVCYTFKTYDYFYNKVKELNPNDEIEILGVIQLDYSDLDSKKDNHEITDYIEVLDIKMLESKKLNDDVLKTIYKSFEDDPDYQDKIINSIHSYSKEIYEYYIEKILMILAWITSDSFSHEGTKRNTQNIIIGGHRGLFKSSIAEALQDILGSSNIGIISGKDTTNKGLIPTTRRVSDQKNLVKKLGAIPYYSRKVLVIDEAQYLEDVSLESMKCLEVGKITRALDGAIINAPAETAIVLLMNYKGNKEQKEAYNYDKPLYQNLGFPEGQESILDRFDLHYAIPNLSKRIKKMLRRRLFKPPIQGVSNEIIFNYLVESKRLYSEGIKLPTNMIAIIESLDDTVTDLKDSKEINTTREFAVLLKLIKAISALRLKDTVDERDLEFLKKHLISTIIPFHGNRAIANERIVNINEVFQLTFKLLTELHDSILISEHIRFIKEYLRNHFFPVISEEPLEPYGLYNYIGKENNKANTKYKKMFEDPDNLEFIDRQGYFIDTMNTATCFLKKEWVSNQVSVNLTEIFNDNKKKALDYDNLIQILEINLKFTPELMEKQINDLIEKGLFSREGKNLKISKLKNKL